MTNTNEKILYKDLSYRLQGLFFDIRNDLGSGHKESIYQKALEKELIRAKIKFIKEPPIKIYSSKGEFLGLYRPDFLIEDEIVIELKAVEHISRQEIARAYDYLRNSKYELGYLINFSSPSLYVKRLIFTNDRKDIPRIATNLKRIATNIILFVVISSLFVAIRGVQAAELKLNSSVSEIAVGQKFQVDLLLNAEGEEINASEGAIEFPRDILEFKEVRDGNSIINFWVEKPDNPRIANRGEIVFSGITPGGFSGANGLIFSIIFQVKKNGEGAIALQNIKVLKNDGVGTPADVKNYNYSFVAIRDVIRDNSRVSPKDTEPPEAFTPQIARDPSFFGGKYFLVFATQDKGFGVDYYAVHESTRIKEGARIATNEWVASESPYLLKDQKLQSYIYIKAVDKAGNERIAVLPAQNHPGYADYLIYAIIILTAIIIYRTWRILWKKEKS